MGKAGSKTERPVIGAVARAGIAYARSLESKKSPEVRELEQRLHRAAISALTATPETRAEFRRTFG